MNKSESVSDPPVLYSVHSWRGLVVATDSTRPTVVRFGSCEADLRTGEVRVQGNATRLQDKPLQLLALLLEKPGELVTREEIRERIWGPSRYHDFEDSLNQAVRKLRDALRDSASAPRFIETIPRRGYRLLTAPAQQPSSAGVPARTRSAIGREQELAELQA